ncbi:MAG: DNA-formamidopyrimidine glycosylase [Oscillatoriaceae bacterium SKW80]|nr:DNA-formamidopyrimidine glycosylase [Oscillatoriaceae bacterium SKYG93]MCX8122093.1 DNA-formamidopyrimidine glycosylase [Oscillatoriaceae bacterium SKW80]MDW8454379.1 DNA-formamidopyrimidine glycosylase [Oscillatoriaceae cyanobacterium SKYGB_i_bin93]HIK29244.1 DNA-formamidopyrimidine glycosylase [Oscillatoriaceae cyanobacterium M7585_C2015_266]
MPELPEVETVRLGLEKVTLGQKILGGEVLLERSIAYPFPAIAFLSAVSGAALAHWHRRGKYLLASLGQHGWLGVHLRMTGQLLWLYQQEPLQQHVRVRLFFEGGRELRFVDQRTFGQMWWVPPGIPPEKIITGIQKLGAEPFSSEFSVDYFLNKLHKCKRPIKTALLEQSIVAGVGNIYADEALFKAGIRPTKPCNILSYSEVERLHAALIQVLQEALALGGSTIRNFLTVEGVNGNYAGAAWVYNRTGKPCRICSAPIERLKLAGRGSHFCPYCQQ